jgi:DNA mismatch repair protein MutL
MVGEVLTELQTLPEPGAARERALAAMACRAAVKAGQTLDVEEMRAIVIGLERTARPATCPHGRPTMIHLSHSQMEREFGRR